VVTSGQITFRWPDREETYGEGDAYFAPPGHLPLITAGTGVVEFSPTAELQAVQAVVGANMVAERFVQWLETGKGAEEVFAPDVFGDVTLPHWRLQAATAAELIAVRTTGHPCLGSVRVERLDPTPKGWVMQIEERWTDESGAPGTARRCSGRT
jgi:hypothetical protein